MCNCFILLSALEIQCERDRMRRFVERWNNEAELLSPEKTFSRCFPDSLSLSLPSTEKEHLTEITSSKCDYIRYLYLSDLSKFLLKRFIYIFLSYRFIVDSKERFFQEDIKDIKNSLSLS